MSEVNIPIEASLLPLQEPDVIASTKASSSINTNLSQHEQQSNHDVPVAPPRRKKKLKSSASSNSLLVSVFHYKNLNCRLCYFLPFQSNKMMPDNLPSPTKTIESLTKELEHPLIKTDKSLRKKSKSLDKKLQRSTSSKSSSIRSGKSLDIKQATQGQFVVKPQDIDKLKADRPVNDGADEIIVDNLGGVYLNDSSSNIKTSHNRNSVGHYSLGPHRYVDANFKIVLV